MNFSTPGGDEKLSANTGRTGGVEIYVSNKNPSYQKQSELLGSILQKQLASVYDTYPSLLKRQAGIFVLDQNVCPSLIVECGYLNNDKDRTFIAQEKNQELIAQKILDAIQQYASAKEHNAQPQPVVDTVPKSKKEITTVDVRTRKEIAITYSDGTSEVLTEQEATARGLINNGGYGNEKKGTQNQTLSGTVRLKPGAISPLYIVDEKEITEEGMSKIDTKMIESINVLKDKSAIDKYGTKGKNGVVEITMKKNELTSHKEPIFEQAQEPASIDPLEWRRFLEKELKMVAEAIALQGALGTYVVQVHFVVNKDGSLADIKSLNNPGFELDKKIMQIVRNSPRWIPAKQNGITVSSYANKNITVAVNDPSNSSKLSINKPIPNTTPEQIKQMTLRQLAGLNPNDEIVSLVLTIDDENGDVLVSNVNGDKLNEYGKKIIQTATKGRMLTIDQIRIKRDGADKKLASKVYIM